MIFSLIISLLATASLNAAVPAEHRPKPKNRLRDTVKLEAIDVVQRRGDEPRITRLPSVGVGVVYAAKKAERVNTADMQTVYATNTARQAFATVAGVNVWESDPAGLQLSIGARGLNPNRMINFTTRQNGYDISADPLGYPESYYTPLLQAVDHIDVIRGARALRYGSQFGGTINFIMKEGARHSPFAAEATVTGGSYGLFSGYLEAGGTSGQSNYIGIVQQRSADAWRANSAFRQTFAYGAYTHQFSDRLRVKIDATKMYYLARQPGGLTDSMFYLDPQRSARNRNWMEIDWNMASATLDWQLAHRVRLRSLFFVNASSRLSVGNVSKITIQDDDKQRTVIDDRYVNIGNETTLRIDDTLAHLPFSLLGGVRVYRGASSRKQGLGSASNDPEFAFANPGQLEGFDYTYPSTNTALFSEVVVHLDSHFKIVPGLRYEHISTSAEGMYRLLTTDSNGNQVYAFPREQLSNNRGVVLAGVGCAYSVADNSAEIYANATQNYRAINFSDLRITSPTLVVDPNLRDAHGYTLDLGIRGSIGSLIEYDASFFAIEYRDRIGEINAVDALGKAYRLRTNLSNAYSRGLEWVHELHVSKLIGLPAKAASIDWLVNACILSSRYQSQTLSSIDGKRLEYAPDVNLRTGVSVSWEPLNVSVLYSYVGKQYADATNSEFDPTAASGVIPSYDVVDVIVGSRFDRYAINLSVNNLLGSRYFTRRSDGYPGPGIIPAEPLTVNASISVSL